MFYNLIMRNPNGDKIKIQVESEHISELNKVANKYMEDMNYKGYYISHYEEVSSKPKIIMVSGNKGHGKDTIAEMINKYYESRGHNVKSQAFANEFKILLSKTFDISIEQLDNLKNSNSNIKSDNDILDTNMRKILQNFGESAKSIFGKYVWCKPVEDNLIDGVNIITDLRLKLEEDYFKERYDVIVIKVHRPSKQKEDSHVSESEIEFINENYLIINESLEQLKLDVQKILNKIKL